MSALHPITGIGLGPGDPDLITLKAFKALQDADVIFYPASEITEDNTISFSLVVLRCLGFEDKSEPLLLPMYAHNRKDNYINAYNIAKKAYLQGKKIAIVSEGDILFYSTFGYILELIQADNIPYCLIPGIPSFILATAATGKVLVNGNKTLRVLALPQSFDIIKKNLSAEVGLVVMKPKKLKGWYAFLAEISSPFFYVEYLGTEKQFITADKEMLKNREIPYFAMFIFYT